MAKGLKANVMRMGNLTNRLSDGRFQKNYESNAFLKRVKGVIELGVLPDNLLGHYVEFTPVDEAAKAIMTITRSFSDKQTVFHINSTKVVYMDQLLKHLSAIGYSVKVVPENEFSMILRKTAKESNTKHILEMFINDLDDNDHLNYESNIHIDNEFTAQYLKKLGFEWTNIDFDYIKKYIDWFISIGFLSRNHY